VSVVLFPSLITLLATIAIEEIVAVLLGFRRLWKQVILVNLITHPLLSATLLLVGQGRAWVPQWHGYAVTLPELLALETLIVLVEAGLLTWSGRSAFGRMLLLSVTMNVASLGVGLLFT
jgi:hypothetical protein